jgi:PAS domain S-box-containing protein
MATFEHPIDARLTSILAGLDGDGAEELSRLVHELQIHQIELEQQNRELVAMRGVLEESRERYADLYDFAPVGYLTLDVSGRILSLNLTGAALLGVPRERVLGHSLDRFVAREDRKAVKAHLARTLDGHEHQNCELRPAPRRSAPTREDRVLMIESLAETRMEATQIRVVLTDITERRVIEHERMQRAAEAAVAGSRARLISGLEGLLAATSSAFNPDTVLDKMIRVVQEHLQADRAWLLYPCDPTAIRVEIVAEAAIPDCPGASLLGRSIPLDPSLKALVCAAQDTPGVLTELDPISAEVLGGGCTPRFRMVALMHAGERETYLLGVHQCHLEHTWSDDDRALFRSLADRIGQIIEMLGVRWALTESEERFRATFDQAAVGLAHVNRQGVFVRVNDKLCSISGYSEEELLGLTYGELTHPDDREAVSKFVEHIRAGHRSKPCLEHRAITKQGETIWCNLTTAALHDSDGRFKYDISVIEDISTRKALEGTERTHRAALARVGRLSTLGAMASGIAHEVSQPLMAIGTYAGGAIERLQSDAPDPRAVRTALFAIARIAERAGRIVERMRAFSRQTSSTSGPLDLCEVVWAGTQIVDAEAKAHRATIEASCPSGLPQVWGDLVQLEQVLINLLLNGLDAMASLPPEQRCLSIEVGVIDADQVKLTVGDRGEGLDACNPSQLFDPFYTTKDEGTGLGLSISRAIIEAHGGTIWAEPRPGGGALFGFRLPIHRDGETP